MTYDYSAIGKIDPTAKVILESEESRQARGLELIPSENYVSLPVRQALASSMTNKYSEGYPGRRYYGGQDFTDEIESLAQLRAQGLFNAKYVNVQPLSGAPANLAVYSALLQPGDTILGMDLTHGGHLTHGHPLTLASHIYHFVGYKMADVETGEIDYQKLRMLAKECRPKLILGGFSSYPRDIDWKELASIANEVGALSMADVAHIAGLIAAGKKENPLDCGISVMTTTTHKTLRGPRGGMILTNDLVLSKAINGAVFPGIQGGPHMNNIAAKAVAFGEAEHDDFIQYASDVLLNAKEFEKVFKKENVKMITSGTSNHLLVIDTIVSFGLSGKEAETLLDSIGITVNKNVIPDDPRGALDPSGIRLGTPALTTRGIKVTGSNQIASVIVSALRNKDDRGVLSEMKQRILKIAAENPVPDYFC